MSRFEIDRERRDRGEGQSSLLVLVLVLTLVNTGLLFYFNIQLRGSKPQPPPPVVVDTVQPDLIAELPADTTNAGAEVAASLRGVKVQVLNGVGTPGVAASVADRLARDGARVVGTGNARSFANATTVIYARIETALPAARRIAQVMSLDASVSHKPLSPGDTTTADVTVVIGADYR